MKKLFGNAVVGQSGGPTTAINATLSGVIRGIRQGASQGQIQTLFGMRNGMEGLEKENLISLLPYFHSEENLRLLEQTPAAALGTCRKKLPDYKDDPQYYERLVEIFKKNDIRFLFYIGGNDSMDTVAKLSRFSAVSDYEFQVIGIPKTIDNDLMGTDHTPGYGSAAKYVAVTTQEIIRDCAVYTTPAVTVLELMGRDAGWLTASAGVGRAVSGFAPDYIYVPERVFDPEKCFCDIENALSHHPNVVIALSEGVKTKDGLYLSQSMQKSGTDAFGHTIIGGAGTVLSDAIKSRFGIKSRCVELNLPQRCAGHLASQNDISESVALGKYAVSMVTEGRSGEMLSIERVTTNPYQIRFVGKPVSEIANSVRTLPDEFINSEGNNITNAFCDWCQPLILGELSLLYDRGIPRQWVF